MILSQDKCMKEEIRQIDVDLCVRGEFQPRRQFNQQLLQELANSIDSVGLMQPIVVRPAKAGDGRYEIIAGERRWRAMQLAGHDTIPAIIRDVSDEDTASMALIENLQREDLDAIEYAEALQTLITRFDYQHHQLANELGVSRATVTNNLRLLKLPLRVKEWIAKRQLNVAAGKSLAVIEDPNVVIRLATRCLKGAKDRLNMRQLESAIKNYNTNGFLKGEQAPAKKGKPRDIIRLEDRISEQVGHPVEIRIDAKTQKGEVAFKFDSAASFEYLLENLKPIRLE